MIPLVFALMLAQDGSGSKPIIEGVVVNALTNEPLRKVHVSLNDKKSFEVLTGDDGKFRFEGIDPELYQVVAERQGFLTVNEEWLEVAAGEHIDDLVIRMTPQGAIAGHVVDDDGDPVPRARISLEHRVHVNGAPSSSSGKKRSRTTKATSLLGRSRLGAITSQ